MTLQRRSAHQTEVSEVPPIVHEVVRSPGQPLEPNTCRFMESRFGQDFSQVRVHTNDQAAKSAQAVNALAYTVGKDVVFASGQYQPNTSAGKKVLAHELTHVLQQNAMSYPPMSTLKIGSSNDFYEREADAQAEKAVSSDEALITPTQRSDSAVQRLGDLTKVPAGLSCPIATTSSPPATDSILFPNRGVALSPLQKAQIENFVRNWRASGASAPVRVDGFASQLGADELNWRLSCDRAQAVVAELTSPSSGTVSGIPASAISVFAQGETGQFGSDAENRRVTLHMPSPAPPTPPTPAQVCGPDVTSAVAAALSKVRTSFAGWSSADKDAACEGFTSTTPDPLRGGNPAFLNAWDIEDLHSQTWINTAPYSPPCATPNPPCQNTVTVGGNCFYAGSVNYVVFGVMWNLCRGHFTVTGPVRFSETSMVALIDAYKGPIPGVRPAAGNWIPSREWAKAGYTGWSGGTTPAADRAQCSPNCPVAYSGPAFTVYWYPHGSF